MNNDGIIIDIEDTKTKEKLIPALAGKFMPEDLNNVSFKQIELNKTASGEAACLKVCLSDLAPAEMFALIAASMNEVSGMAVSFAFEFSPSINPAAAVENYWGLFCAYLNEDGALLAHAKPAVEGSKLVLKCSGALLASAVTGEKFMFNLRRGLKKFFNMDFEVSCDITEKDEMPTLASGYTSKVEEGAGSESEESEVIRPEEIKGKPVPVEEVSHEGRFVMEGRIFTTQNAVREFTGKKSGETYIRVTFYLTDEKDTIKLFAFVKPGDCLARKILGIKYARVSAEVKYDDRDGEMTGKVTRINILKPAQRTDESEKKRCELHAHTKMSAMDGLMGIDQYVEAALSWNMPAFAVTDHGVVHAFPEMFKAVTDRLRKKHPDLFEVEINGKKRYRALDEAYKLCIEQKGAPKLILGMEGYLIEDRHAEPPKKDDKEEKEEKVKPWHIIILAKNRTGLQNLYRIVSESHIKYFYKKPRIPRSLLMKYREGLILGSACWMGEVYQAFLKNEPEEKIEETAKLYDYLEIQPDTNNDFLVRKGMADPAGLHEINRKIVRLAKKTGKPYVATCDAHFCDKNDRRYREFLMLAMGFDESEAEVYLRTTDEMMNEFNYLDSVEAREAVIENTNLVASWIEPGIIPVPEKLNPPNVADADDRIRRAAWNRAEQLYGENVHPDVKARLERELDAVIGNKYSVLYLIAMEMVKKSNAEGYIVGSRGSVGSSFAAYLCGITEVNPLRAHYICTPCRHFEFADTDLAGVDLPDKKCPVCGLKMVKDGFNIPFETFMGFKGDKVPDIDLNFSGEYQEKIHKFVVEMFGAEQVFRAGTIGTLQENAVRKDFVNKYMEKAGVRLKEAEKTRLAMGCRDVKRSVGQHPGGLMLVPAGRDVHEFTPVQLDKDKENLSTHFDYHYIHDALVKIDALGHQMPTSFKHLCDALNVKFDDIPLDDVPTMQIFSSLKPLGVKGENYDLPIGTLGVPEYGTQFSRGMLNDTKPKTFTELVYIAGLSHGTDVWLGNAKDLIINKTATLKEVISVRDDIMNYLISKGLPKDISFKITEQVRKGKGLNPAEEEIMVKHKVPEWYISSCKKIKYMFPKAHAVAYAMMSVRIAYIKVHHPPHFYADYFNRTDDGFEYEYLLLNTDTARKKLREIKMTKEQDRKKKDETRMEVLEVLFEMRERGVEFSPVSIYESNPVRFTVKDGKVLPPLTVLPQLGKVAAEQFACEREKAKFSSFEDMIKRTKLNKNVIEFMKDKGIVKGLPQSDQAVLF